jgi:hypothetical protein
MKRFMPQTILDAAPSRPSELDVARFATDALRD